MLGQLCQGAAWFPTPAPCDGEGVLTSQAGMETESCI